MINRKIDVWPCLLLTFQRLISTSKNYSGALLFFLFLQRAYLWAFHFSNFSTWNRPGSQKQWRSLYHEFSQKQISKAVYNFWIHSTAVKWIWVFYYNFFCVCLCYGIFKKNDFGYCLWALPKHCEMKKIWRSVSAWYSQCHETDRVLHDLNYISLLYVGVKKHIRFSMTCTMCIFNFI